MFFIRFGLNSNVLKDVSLPELIKPERATCCPNIVPEGLVSLDWVNKEGETNLANNTPIVIIVPGLTGSSDSGYVRRLAGDLKNRNSFPVKVACYNPRGVCFNFIDALFHSPLLSVPYISSDSI